jgi:hypothetical protein
VRETYTAFPNLSSNNSGSGPSQDIQKNPYHKFRL